MTLLLLGGAAACGDDNGGAVTLDDKNLLENARREAREATDAVEEAGERAGARAVAEAVRAALVVEDLETGEHLRDVDVLREAVEDIPGEPEVTGIDDGDGDGRDDDGRLEFVVDGERACLTVPDGGGDIDVRAGAC